MSDSSSPKNSETDHLINSLSDQDIPTCRCSGPFFVFGLWLGTAVVFLTVYILMFGMRPDIETQIQNPAFLFEAGLCLFLFLSAAFVAGLYSVPDMRGRSELALIPATIFGIMILWLGFHMYAERAHMIEMIRMGHCMKEGVILSFLPYLIAMIFMARGYTTRPYIAAFLHAGAAVALSWLSMKLICSLDNSFHSLVNHILPMTAIALVGGIFARRLFKW